VYVTDTYDCDYSKTNDNQTKACSTIRHAPEISRVGTLLAHYGKEHGVSGRSALVWDNRGYISMTDLCGCWRTRRISSAVAGL